MIPVAILVLLLGIFLVTTGVLHLATVWLQVVVFWGRVAYRNPDKIEYSFKFNIYYIAGGVFGAACVLWSVIKLAALI